MEYRGFSSISMYESECKRLGYATKRIPYKKGSEDAFLLVTEPPGHPTGTSVAAWTLFSADETKELLDGIISGGQMDPTKYLRNGMDVNFDGKLAAHGYFPADQQPAKPKIQLFLTADDTQYSLFSPPPADHKTKSRNNP